MGDVKEVTEEGPTDVRSYSAEFSRVGDLSFCTPALYHKFAVLCQNLILDKRKNRMQASETKYLRKVIGKTRRDQIRNIKIRN
jgi:hypothetical protein